MSYRIAGVINGHYGTRVKVRAHHAISGALLAETIVDTGSYELIVPSKAECYLVLLPDMGDVWQTGRFHAIGDHVYPPNYAETPYYFECTDAGAVGQSPPAFTDQALTPVVDGGCVWQRVERIPAPMIHFPVTPIIF